MEPNVSLTIDVLPTILKFISSLGDLLNLSLVSRSIHYYTKARLYDGRLFRCTSPHFGSQSCDYRQYVKLLHTLGSRPDLAARVRIFVVPHMKLPHERYDDIWERALANCVHIEDFRWRSGLPVPFSIIQNLTSKSRLRVLSLPPGRISLPINCDALLRIRPLEELVLQSPPKHFGPRCIEWIMGMSASLRLLDLENAEWIDDYIFQPVVLPNLRVLTLHNCGRLTAAGILPLLRSASRLEVLYLGPIGVKVAGLVRPDDNSEPLRLPSLRKIFINWDSSLAFWIHVQELLDTSPIETFHIIRSSIENRPIEPNPLIRLNELDSDIAALAQFYGFPMPPEISISEWHMLCVDEGFVSRFVHLHRSTLRKFWVLGLRCPDKAVRDLCYGCDKLERLRADGVDEYPLIERPAIEKRPFEWFWWPWGTLFNS